MATGEPQSTRVYQADSPSQPREPEGTTWRDFPSSGIRESRTVAHDGKANVVTYAVWTR